MTKKLPTTGCDCLTDCGDDPNITKYQVKPCKQFVRFNLYREDIVKMWHEEELIPLLQEDAIYKLKQAEKVWHKLFALMPIGDDRAQAAEIFENIRNANRITKAS